MIIIYSLSGVTTPYSIQLDQVGWEYWLPPREILRVPVLATSTEDAGVFTHENRYGASGITKTFNLVMSKADADYLVTMRESEQTEWYVSTASGIFKAKIEVIPAPPSVPDVVLVQLQIFVLSEA